MAIAVTVRGDDLASVRRAASLLESAADEVEVVALTTTAADAERAVQDLLPDVVLIDLDEPMDSVACEAQRMHSLSPSTRAVIVTAPSEDAIVLDAFRAGAAGVVARGSSASVMAKTVKDVAAGRMVVPAGVVDGVVRTIDEAVPGLLGARERDVLAGMAEGRSVEEIASACGVTVRAVHRRVEDVFAKFYLAVRLGAGDRERDRSGAWAV